jgi:hypothetical protein
MSFGIFDSLAQYGVLGFAVMGLGYLCWIFINRQMKSEDELRERVKELEDEYRDGYEKTIKDNTSNSKSLKETVMLFLANGKK